MDGQGSHSVWRNFLRERMWVIVLAIMIAMGVAGGEAFFQTPQYSARAVMMRSKRPLIKLSLGLPSLAT